MQAAITADRIRVSLDFFLLIEPTYVYTVIKKNSMCPGVILKKSYSAARKEMGSEGYRLDHGLRGTCHQVVSLFLEHHQIMPSETPRQPLLFELD